MRQLYAISYGAEESDYGKQRSTLQVVIAEDDKDACRKAMDRAYRDFSVRNGWHSHWVNTSIGYTVQDILVAMNPEKQ